MQKLSKLFAAAAIVAATAVPMQSADAFWGWGGPWGGYGYPGYGWGGYPGYGGWGGYPGYGGWGGYPGYGGWGGGYPGYGYGIPTVVAPVVAAPTTSSEK